MEGAQPSRGVSKACTRVQHPDLGARPESSSGEGERRERVRAREKRERLDASISVRWGHELDGSG